MTLSSLRADDEFVYMRWSTQQEENVSAHEKKQLSSKEELISFSPAEDTLKKRPVAPVGPSQAPPDVAPPSPSPSPTPPQTASSAQLSGQEQKTQELMLQEKLLKRDREIKMLQETVAKLKQQLAASQSAQQRMAKNNMFNDRWEVVERHSSALAQLAASKVQQESQQSQQLQRLRVERDEAREEVANIETMFADLHRKYEKSKALVAENRQSSELVSAELDHALSQVSREQQRYDMLQQYAEDTMQRLQTDMELEQKSQETEALRMSARLQLAENRATKLERENQEVTAICDELIQKMGGHR
ncbi:Transforming acidic coiled-coil-containing protein 2 [Amphibalanus amphitrite]|uniref:Transforming acidic coiled-coil-containing protein 2 n=1 Tax=Amphibalanus amphitrite TaxID=1232801 RepID=A0A6A4VBN7_AMPAM|nr:Transforming acidic coiled-coil-containing protein 2 [Amphibalanus amphitrite]